jgi:hypothetical protein
MSLIQKLIRNGNLKLWHHYKRHAMDLSGNSNNGAHTDTSFNGQGLAFSKLTSRVTVLDSPELQMTTGTLLFFSDSFLRDIAGARILISKRDAGGVNYSLRISSNNLQFLDSALVARTLAFPGDMKLCGVNFSDTEIPNGFSNGNFLGNFSGTVSVLKNDADLQIGNLYSGGQNSKDSARDALVINRKLTAKEHSTLYGELSALKHSFDSRPYAINNAKIKAPVKNVPWSTATKPPKTSIVQSAGHITKSTF